MVDSTVDAVIFDWGGTLTPWHTIEWGEQWRSYATAYDPAAGDAVTSAWARALTEAEGIAWQRARDEHRSSTFEAVVRAGGLEPAGQAHERGLAAFRAFWEPHTYTDPDVLPLFTALRQAGLRIGVLSNTVWSRAEHELVFRRDGVFDLIDGAVYSSEIAWTKPHPEAFRAALTSVGAGPARTVFVGDRLFDDVYGAQAVGMRAVHVPHSEIPPEQRGHTDGEPDAVIQRLSELRPLVEEWCS